MLLAGALILGGSVAMSRYVREYETALLKALGATAPTLLAVLVVEYGLLGVVAGLVGATLGTGLARIVSESLLDLSWRFDPQIGIAGVLGAAVLAAVVGVVSCADLLRVKPLFVLRREE